MDVVGGHKHLLLVNNDNLKESKGLNFTATLSYPPLCVFSQIISPPSPSYTPRAQVYAVDYVMAINTEVTFIICRHSPFMASAFTNRVL